MSKDEKNPEFCFEKFINDLSGRVEESETRIKDYQDSDQALPQRKYNKLYRERWQNRIKFRRNG